MLTVGNFAALCACSPRTLRYYDRVELLKPLRVDEWTGYRYYDEGQLRDYWRIRDLQQAGFSISEIRALLRAPAEEVRKAAVFGSRSPGGAGPEARPAGGAAPAAPGAAGSISYPK